jgi:hypothetical protein
MGDRRLSRVGARTTALMIVIAGAVALLWLFGFLR